MMTESQKPGSSPESRSIFTTLFRRVIATIKLLCFIFKDVWHPLKRLVVTFGPVPGRLINDSATVSQGQGDL